MRKIVYQSQNLETHLDRSNHYNHHQKTSNNLNNSSFHPLSLLSFYPFFHTASISTSIVLTSGPPLCNLPRNLINQIRTDHQVHILRQLFQQEGFCKNPTQGNKIMNYQAKQVTVYLFFYTGKSHEKFTHTFGESSLIPPQKMGPIWYGLFLLKQKRLMWKELVEKTQAPLGKSPRLNQWCLE